MADEVNASFLLPGPPATHVAAWRSDPPPFLEDYKRVDESYESLVYESDVTTTFMKWAMFGMGKTIYRLSFTFRDADGGATQVGVRRVDVGRRVVELVALDHAERVAHARLVLALEARLDAPEHVGHEHDVAVRGEAVGQAAHVVVDPEDLLEQEDPGPGACAGHRAVRVERAVAECPGVEFHRYEAPAGHAFSNWDAPSMYHEPAAESAWDRSLAFLDAHLR